MAVYYRGSIFKKFSQFFCEFSRCKNIILKMVCIAIVGRIFEYIF